MQDRAAACAVRPLDVSPRLRARRGRRSHAALARRRSRWLAGEWVSSESSCCECSDVPVSCDARPPDGDASDLSSPSVGCGQSQSSPTEPCLLSPECFAFFLLNLRGFVSHSAELVAVIEELNFPTFVCLNETLLPGERAMRKIILDGYSLVSRLDRRDNSGWGGIALFAKSGFEQCMVHVGDSPVTERSWHILHTDRGPVAVALWYRRPDPGEVVSIQALEPELREFGPDVVGTMILGDLNVHEESWLRYSSGTSIEGREFHEWCSENGIEQHVRKPTRGDYLLDLVLSDLGPLVKTKVVVGISDHHGVLSSVACPIPEVTRVEREVFLYGKARWTDLRRAIVNLDWASVIRPDDADGSAQRFEETMLDFMYKWIPWKTIVDEKSGHEWLDDDCRRLVREKREAWGTTAFVTKRDACTTGLLEAYYRFIRRTKTKLAKLKPSSREWWRISRSLMSLGSASDVIPPLKSTDGVWATTASEKATLLATKFADKSRLDDVVRNDFSDEFASLGERRSDGFIPIRLRYVRKVLKKLDENSGTGPDRIAARVLRRCRDELEVPILLLARVIFNQGRWPNVWRFHWIHPLYKKKSRADAKNYRGVHLTPQISKIIERVIGCAFLPWANRAKLFGENQYAYSTRRSHRDALAVNICNWLRFLEDGRAVGLYCSDVFGAFDRVRRERLVEKLHRSSLNKRVVRFLESWLEDRESVVIVGGEWSERMILANSVFQGTVLGSPLWNIFYDDAKLAIRPLHFTEVVFADDFNCWKSFTNNVHRSEILRQCSACQARLHSWGQANSVKFDAGKESFHILHRTNGFGDDFALLGVTFDTSLHMGVGISIIAREAGWRLKSVLRPRRFFSEMQIVNLYKSQVLSYLESGTPAFYHASTTVLRPLDRVQERLLRELGLAHADALEKYHLAPLGSRRDMGMLGLLHRIVLGDAPPQLAELFPFAEPSLLDNRSATRLAVRRHRHQFWQPPFRTEILRRSLFGIVVVYNLLPPAVVEKKTVKSFQSILQLALRSAVRKGLPDWHLLFSPRTRPVSWKDFQRFFL